MTDQPDDLQALTDLLEAQTSVFARTMPHNPHEYTLRKTWANDDDFVRAVLFIRTRGAFEWWPDPVRGRCYVYLDLNGWHYRTMGDPLGRTVLINRKRLG
jgi:hypothetical protein